MLSNGLILHERYRIVRQIGKGGTSSVYLAEDISIGKKWAVKYLPAEEDDVGWLAQNEINMMIKLDHHAFPRIVDAWQESNAYIIVSDYIEGITLDRILSKETINKRTLISWCIEIAEALLYLHSCNPSILYLDLKLENIMIKQDGSLKLIDFGIAGRIAEQGSLYGTPGYAAPEQYYNQGELLDERTDIFAFGMLMYAIFTKQRPLTNLKQQRKIIQSNKRIPNKIKNIILRCVNENKNERYNSVGDLLKELNLLSGKRTKLYIIRSVAAAAILSICIFGLLTIKMVVAEPVDNASERLVSELSEHIENGEYTDEGIRIITGYIESGCLDKDTEERFTYEVARNYFEIKKNYREAIRYFKYLDEEHYPEAIYYIRLCEIQSTFEEDKSTYLTCLEEFENYNKGLGYTDSRFDNELMMATLYEGIPNLTEDEAELTLNCLLNGLSELEYAISENLYLDENNKYRGEFLRRLCIVYEGLNDADNMIKYGEKALSVLSDEEKDVKNDIRERVRSKKDY